MNLTFSHFGATQVIIEGEALGDGVVMDDILESGEEVFTDSRMEAFHARKRFQEQKMPSSPEVSPRGHRGGQGGRTFCTLFRITENTFALKLSENFNRVGNLINPSFHIE